MSANDPKRTLVRPALALGPISVNHKMRVSERQLGRTVMQKKQALERDRRQALRGVLEHRSFDASKALLHDCDQRTVARSARVCRGICYPAVLFAALFGGLAVGIFAIVLGGVISWWAFLPPYFVFSPLTSGQAISLLSYLFASLLVVWAAEHYRRLTKGLEDEENFRKLAVEELAHRLKNKLATIQSIISFQLRDEPQTRDAIFLLRSQPPTILL